MGRKRRPDRHHNEKQVGQGEWEEIKGRERVEEERVKGGQRGEREKRESERGRGKERG